MENIDTSSVEQFLEPLLPTKTQSGVFITATWAQSLDGRIAAAPGERTQLSGLYSKKMTHFLRTKHDAILVGRRTVAADNPRLCSRYSANCSSPRPVILDSELAWDITDANWQQWNVLKNGANGAKGPYVLVNESTAIDPVKKHIIEDKCGGEIVPVPSTRDWQAIRAVLASRGVRSVMVEGGSLVLDSCLRSGVVNAVIITIAPVFLGRHGVDIAPGIQHQLENVRWWSDRAVPDGVVAGTLKPKFSM